ncbi:MAG: hypothetical protein D6731_02195, partial [Planctomycetota bacterium]
PAPEVRAPEAPPPASRHEDKLQRLLRSGRLSAQEAEQVRVEARGRGLSPGEVLLDRGFLTLAEWTEPRRAAGWGTAAAVALALLGLALLGFALLWVLAR